MSSRDKCIELLKELTGQDKVLFTPRGNYSIKLALKLMQHLEVKNILTQDQGGWMTYRQFIEEFGLKERKLKTGYGLVKVGDLKELKASESALLVNSMPGYAALQDMKALRAANESIIIINDASGSIGSDEAKVGDIILGSFAEDKPVDIEKGGFIATGNDDYYKFFKQNMEWEVKIKFGELYKKLTKLGQRLLLLKKVRQKILKDLKNYNIIHRDKDGINVIIKCNDSDKEKLINYCKKHKYEYTECPRYIRINDKGVSIEVKRLR